MDADDRALVRRAAAGDGAALNGLYERHADMLFAFAVHLARGSRPEAEDIWQETWLAAVRSLPDYDAGRSGFFAWLCGIARHKAADSRRRAARRPAESLSGLPDDRSPDLADGGPSPEQVWESKTVQTAVLETLSGLPAPYRRALVARYAEGMSVEETAEREGRSYKAAESLLERARRAFRRDMKKRMGDAHAERS